MPKFDSVKGGQVFIPAGRVLYVESGEGGLTSNVVVPSLMKQGIDVVEVSHTVAHVGEAIIAELRDVVGK